MLKMRWNLQLCVKTSDVIIINTDYLNIIIVCTCIVAIAACIVLATVLV